MNLKASYFPYILIEYSAFKQALPLTSGMLNYLILPFLIITKNI